MKPSDGQGAAICHLLTKGTLLLRDGKPVEVGREIPNLPREELKKWAKSEGIRFVDWWPRETKETK